MIFRISSGILLFFLVLWHVFSFVIVSTSNDGLRGDYELVSILEACYPKFTPHRCMTTTNRRSLQDPTLTEAERAHLYDETRNYCMKAVQGLSNLTDAPIDQKKCTRALNGIQGLLPASYEQNLKKVGVKLDGNDWDIYSPTKNITPLIITIISLNLLLLFLITQAISRKYGKPFASIATEATLFFFWNIPAFLTFAYLFFNNSAFV